MNSLPTVLPCREGHLPFLFPFSQTIQVVMKENQTVAVLAAGNGVIMQSFYCSGQSLV